MNAVQTPECGQSVNLMSPNTGPVAPSPTVPGLSVTNCWLLLTLYLGGLADLRKQVFLGESQTG